MTRPVPPPAAMAGPLFTAGEAAAETGRVLWFVPIDQYGRALPPAAVLPGDSWHAAALWGQVACAAAEALGECPGRSVVVHASTTARWAFYETTGDRAHLAAETGGLLCR